MKITVYTLVILSLIGGLTLLSVNSNTDTELPYQSLSEAEMLTTQGTWSVSNCEEVSLVGEFDVGRWDFCKTKDCTTIWNGRVHASYKQFGGPYRWCNGKVNPNKDCRIASTEAEGTQSCGHRQEYWGGYCISWLARPLLRDLLIADAQNKPHNPNIPCSSS